MKKITQTSLYDPKTKSGGNCMMACYSSYLDLPLEKVPPIHELFNTKIPKGFWWDTLLAWFKEVGCEYTNRDTDPYRNPKDWGLKKPWSDYYFVSGPSPRDKSVHHLVIFKKGKLYWDPHPDRTGVLSKSYYEILAITDRGQLSRFQDV